MRVLFGRLSGQLLKVAAVTGGGVLLASCVTLPYETAFNGCEAEANSCYRICEDIPDERGYTDCQSHCDRSANRCFDQAYDAYQSSSYGYGGYGSGYGNSGYGYGSPWYGRYGSWYPSYGFYLDYRSYDRYGYRKQRPYPPRYNNQPRGGNYGGNPNNQPGYQPPRRNNQAPPRGQPRVGRPPVGEPPAGQADEFRGQRQGGRAWAPPSTRQPAPARSPAQPRPNFTPPPQSAPQPAPQPTYTPPPASAPQAAPRVTPPPRSSEDRPQRPSSPRDEGERQPN